MIVDDEPPAREYLRSLLDSHPDVEVVDSVGAAGQAVQNMNLVMGLPETMGLGQPPLFI